MQFQKKNKRTTMVGGVIALILLASMVTTALASAKAQEHELMLDFTGLASPGNDHYEGWLIIDGTPVSTGKFTVDESGKLLDLMGQPLTKFTLKGQDLAMATKFVLTLEPEGDTDTVPADIKFVAGDLNSGRTSATLTHNVGVDLSAVSGQYILATPSNNVPSTTYELGQEFENLMALSSGHYEGWLIVDGTPVSTGKFNLDGQGRFIHHTTDALLAAPFLVEDLDPSLVTDFVLSIEPEGDNDAVPAAVKPLAGSYSTSTMEGKLAHNVGVDLSAISGEYILATPSNNVPSTDYQLDLDLENLEPLASGHYEGWLIEDGTPVSTGKFNLDGQGRLVHHISGALLDDSFMVNDLEITEVTKFVLSIEPEGDNDNLPAAVKPLAGDLEQASMDGDLSHNIGVDLSDIGGEYILATPSNGGNTDEHSGVWYLNRSTGTPVAGLDLPDLSSTDWIYEGWAVIDGIPVTSGTFDGPEGADNFDNFSSDQGYPPFPGEDFLLNAPDGVTFPTNLSGKTVVISIEPRTDDDPAPFQFKPLVATVPSDALDHMEYPLDSMVEGLPSGSFELTLIPAGPSDELSGVWYLNRSTGTPVAGLDLPDLSGTDWIYEGWAVIDGVPVSSGTFDGPEGADDFDGYTSDQGYPPFPGEDFLLNAPAGVTFPTNLQGATMVISIEPRVDSDPAPFQFKPLLATVPNDAVDHLEYGLENKVDTLPTGSFNLTLVPAEPTDELSGIWYLDRSSGTPVAGLTLPDLTGTDWTYEGWVVIDGMPVTSGRFDKPAGFDDFDGYSSDQGYPPFPGEDFLLNAPAGVTFPTDLSGQMAVISIEPRVDNDPAPFQFKPLTATIPSMATDHLEYDLDRNTASLATGALTIKTLEMEDDDSGLPSLSLLVVIGTILVVVISFGRYRRSL